VDFTREPIVETVITPKEGYKLVVRSSKSTGQEEYFVDAVEVVSFGQSLFFRSIEKPKCFLVPVSDYEVLEVREARMVLKNVGVDQSIKIAGGRETHIRAPREAERGEVTSQRVEAVAAAEVTDETAPTGKKRERRRHSRRRRGPEEALKEGEQSQANEQEGESYERMATTGSEAGREDDVQGVPSPLQFSALLQPPPTLISETIGRYKETFKEAFFTPEIESIAPHDKIKELLEEEDQIVKPLPEEAYESLLNITEQADEEEPLPIVDNQWDEEASKDLENPEPQYPSKDE
jgi:hypothetical protein